MKVGRGLGALTVAVALTATGACGSSGEADTVAWTDKVCGSLLTFTEKVQEQPDLAGGDPAAAIRGISDYLGGAVTALDSSIAGLEDAGPSPVDGGDQVVDQLQSAFTTIRSSFQDSRAKIDAVDTSDPAALSTGLLAAVEPLNQVPTALAPLDDLRGNPELDAAAAKAPNCQKIHASGG